MAQEDWIPRLQIRHGYLIGFEQYEGTRTVNRYAFKTTREAYSGDITPGSKKRLRKCVDLLLQISPERIIFNPVTNDYQPFSVNFLTLTIPNEKTLDASWCHKNLLEPFLRTLRRKHGLRHYVWKCERQERGQIHYHLTTDTFIVWSDIRNAWNNVLRSTGLMKEFILKHKHANPNSTDIHSVYKIKDVAAYICKYISKSLGENPIDGKVWDASKSLKFAKHFVTIPSAHQQAALSHYAESGKIKLIENDRCKIFKPIKIDLRDMIEPTSLKEYDTYIHIIANSKHIQNNLQTSS